MIKCEICGKEMPVVNWLHLRTHNTSVDKYKSQYPNTVLVDEETKVKVANAVREQYISGRRISGFKKYMDNDAEHRKRYCEMRKQVWANKSEESRAQHIANSIRASHTFPNKIEQYIMSILDFVFPNEWKYVGSGEVIIGRMNPDFINTNSQKKVIEVFGEYWHSDEVVGRNKEDEEKLRIDRFKEYGFDALIIWECDIYNNMPRVRKKLLAFAGGLENRIT